MANALPSSDLISSINAVSDRKEISNSVDVGTIAADFGKSFVQSAVITPVWNGFGQLVSGGHLPQVDITDNTNSDKSSVDAWAQRIGGGLGMAASFFALSKMGRFGPTTTAQIEAKSSMTLGERVLSSMDTNAKVGAVYGMLFQPTAAGKDLLWGRVENMTTEAVTFAALGAGSEFLGGLKVISKIKPGTNAGLAKDMLVSGLAGAPAGVMNLCVDNTFNNKHLTRESLKKAAVDYGIFGFALTGITHGAARAFTTKPGEFSFPENHLELGSGKTYQSRIQESSKRIQQIREQMANLELPTSTEATGTGKYIAEKATQLDAYDLLGEKDATITRLEGDRVLDIKRYINKEGQPAKEYLAKIIKSSDISIVGEQHTANVPNWHRQLGTEVLSELPAGSILAIELPIKLKPIFEKFNSSPGSDMPITFSAAENLSMQQELSLLTNVVVQNPELITMWKTLRDKGIRVEPIDVRPLNCKFTNEAREGGLADNLLQLSETTDKPIVAWIGNLHAAKGFGHGQPFLARRIAESPAFKSGDKKLSTVLSQLAETESTEPPAYTIADQVSEPVGIPTNQDGRITSLGVIKLFPKSAEIETDTNLTLSHFDHVLFYPKAPDVMRLNYHAQRVMALDDYIDDSDVNLDIPELQTATALRPSDGRRRFPPSLRAPIHDSRLIPISKLDNRSQ